MIYTNAEFILYGIDKYRIVWLIMTTEILIIDRVVKTAQFLSHPSRCRDISLEDFKNSSSKFVHIREGIKRVAPMHMLNAD